jgi:Holliday junction resolvase RusA-like endonuclease
VLGTPAAQGSHKAFIMGGKARITAANNAQLQSWRGEVATAAIVAHDSNEPLDGPLELVCEFRFPMPTSRPKRVRDRGRAWRASKPDLDKLVRSVGDALTIAGVIADDARIVSVIARKTEVHGTAAGADISIHQLEEMTS